MSVRRILRHVASLAALIPAAMTLAQDTSISYQGQLKNNGAVIPGPSVYSMTFRLYDAASGGNLLEQKVKSVTVTNSLFTAALDFATIHWSGADRWLEIEVGGTTLTPRQPIRWAPYAIHALNAADRNSLDASDGSPADVVFVDAAGLTGVGTTAPTVKLNIVGGTDVTPTGGGFVQAGASTGANVVLDDNEIMARNNSALAPLYLQNDGGNLIVCQDAGNVGIGTNTPGFPLSFSNDTGDKIALWGQSGDHYGFGIRSNLLQIHSNVSTADIAFGYGTSAAMTETMRIRGNGNVGIGTTSPATKLHVAGPARVTTEFQLMGSGTTVLADLDYEAGGSTAGRGTNLELLNSGTVTAKLSGGAPSSSGVSNVGGLLDLRNVYGTSVVTIAGGSNLSPEESSAGYFTMSDGDGDATIRLESRYDSGTGLVGSALRMYDTAGTTQTVRMIGNGGGGGGALELYNSAGQLTVGADGDEADHGDLRMYRSTGTATIIMEASESGTDGAQIELRNSAGQATIVIDADQSGVGRVTTDVLEITGADLAEKFPASEELQPGMVVAIDVKNEGQLCLARGAYNRTVAGVVSGANDFAAGAILGNRDESADGPPIALAGRVYVWVDADVAPVRPGDLLTTSDTPGHAMKVLDHAAAPGAILGKAMTSLESGRGLVLVLVSLQ